MRGKLLRALRHLRKAEHHINEAARLLAFEHSNESQTGIAALRAAFSVVLTNAISYFGRATYWALPAEEGR